MLSRRYILLSRAAVPLAFCVQEEGSLLPGLFSDLHFPLPYLQDAFSCVSAPSLHSYFAYTFVRPSRLLCPLFNSLFVSSGLVFIPFSILIARSLPPILPPAPNSPPRLDPGDTKPLMMRSGVWDPNLAGIQWVLLVLPP